MTNDSQNCTHNSTYIGSFGGYRRLAPHADRVIDHITMPHRSEHHRRLVHQHWGWQLTLRVVFRSVGEVHALCGLLHVLVNKRVQVECRDERACGLAGATA